MVTQNDRDYCANLPQLFEKASFLLCVLPQSILECFFVVIRPLFSRQPVYASIFERVVVVDAENDCDASRISPITACAQNLSSLIRGARNTIEDQGRSQRNISHPRQNDLLHDVGIRNAHPRLETSKNIPGQLALLASFAKNFTSAQMPASDDFLQHVRLGSFSGKRRTDQHDDRSVIMLYCQCSLLSLQRRSGIILTLYGFYGNKFCHKQVVQYPR